MNIPKPIKPSYSSYVTKTGKLLKHLRPAIFCDTSFLIDYWNSSIHEPTFEQHPLNKLDPIDSIFLEYIKADARTRKIYLIREKIDNFKNKLNLVYTPACRLEMEEVITSLRFRKYGVDVTDSSLILKKGNKEIGDIISKLKSDFLAHVKGKSQEKIDENIRNLFWHFFHTTDRIGEGLPGILEVDILNFSLTKKDFYRIGYLANQQIGFADIFHLITASKLGCKYFFTLDSDFKRIAEDAKDIYKIEIITDPKVMLSTI